MRHARMQRLPHGDRFQDGRTLELAGIGLVGRISRRVERKRIINLRLVIIRIFLRQSCHRLGIGHDTAMVIHLVVVGKHHRQRVDITFLALGLEPDGSRFLDRRRPLREILGRRCDVRIPQQAQGDTPIGDAAGRIGLQRILEHFLRGAVPERVLIQHAAVEQFLRIGVA